METDEDINLFIPAAGLGERLRPITNHIPKPLLPVLGKPVIGHIIERFVALSRGRIGINLYYKADMVCDWARTSAFADRIKLFYEDPILGTGGAIKNASALLSEGPFLVHNSDIVSDIDLMFLIERHLIEGNIATLATIHYPGLNNVVINSEGDVVDIKNEHYQRDKQKVAFTGIAIYSPEILQFLPPGISHITSAWLAASRAGYRVKALDFTGCYWIDIGRPDTYARAIVNELKRQGETLFIHPTVKTCNNAEIHGLTVIEKGSVIRGPSQIRNCIILNNTTLNKGICEDSIIGPDFEIRLNKEIFEGTGEIGTGGSDRRYYRVIVKTGTVVTARYSHDASDLQHHIEYTRFFSRYGIPVPKLIHVDIERKTVTFEDLGDLSLYNWMKCPRSEVETEDMYRKVLDIALDIHTKLINNISECPLLKQRIFDFAHFRWESEYFIRRFVRVYKKDMGTEKNLLEELDKLAERADSFPKTVIHRDFQSQNIMLKEHTPRTIDYQGARIGPEAYDIASLLWDPYVRLSNKLRDNLVEYYINKRIDLSDRFDPVVFLDSLLVCRIQRHMQALGAYGFLSEIKGKRYFLKFAPEALRHLKEETTIVKEEFPFLFELVSILM